MSRRAIVTSIVLAVLAGVPAPVTAEPGAFEVAVGGLWMNKSPLTSSSANETTPGGTAFPLFATSTDLSTLTAAELQIGVHLGRHLEAFGAASFDAGSMSWYWAVAKSSSTLAFSTRSPPLTTSAAFSMSAIFWLPILWIPAVIIVVLGVAYLIRMGRDAATGRTSDVERDPSP